MQHENINIRRPATNIIFFKYLSEQTPKLQPNVVSIYGTYGLFPLTYEYNYQIKSNTRLVRCIGSNMGRFWGRGRGFLNIAHCPGSFVLGNVPFSREKKFFVKIFLKTWQVFLYLVFHITTRSLSVLAATFEAKVYLRELTFPWVECRLLS